MIFGLFAPEGGGGAQDGTQPGEGGEGGTAPPAHAPGESFDFPGWRDGLQDAGMKAAAERFNSIEDMLTSNITLRKEIGDRIRLPGPNATPEDIQKFRKGLGVPDDPKAYKLELPDGVTVSEMDQGLIDAVRPIAHEANMSNAAFNALVNGMVAKAKEVEAETDKALKNAAIEATGELKKEWSTEYDKNRELAYRTITAFGGDGLKATVDQAEIAGFGKLGDWPPFLRLMATIGKRSDEGDMLLGGAGEGRQSAEAELKALVEANPVGSEGYKQNQARIQELYEIIHGKKPVVGSQNRTV